jgi:SpoVK/Ycf46/Vps4 family AAA+-type ATPase
MEQPEIRRKYRLPRCAMVLLCGVSGSGKTFSILGLWRRLYEIMSTITGEPIEKLPPRVMRLRESQFLSKWLGDSDKNLDRFFDEAEKLAGEPFVASDGTSYQLPVLAVLEEVDGLARSRGGEAVYDRILTTALQRLDTSRQELRDKLILFVATTNVVHQVDPAFLRRIGGRVERFGRLNRTAFVSVLETHLRGRPLAGVNGGGPDAAEASRRAMMAEIATWLYGAREKDGGIVELTFAGSTTPEVKTRRDFMTASLVDRAVREAANEAGRCEAAGGSDPGLSASSIIDSLETQIEAIVEQLHVDNVANYVDLPDGVRVVNLLRIPRRRKSNRTRQYIRVA